MTGALAGAGLGLASFALIRHAAARMEWRRGGPDTSRAVALLRSLAFVDLMVFPLIGYVVGPLVLDGR